MFIIRSSGYTYIGYGEVIPVRVSHGHDKVNVILEHLSGIVILPR